MLIRHHRPTKLQKRKRKAQFFRERAAHSNLQYTMKCSIRQHSVNHLISCLMSLMLLEFNRSPQHLVKLKHSRSTHLTQKTDYNDCILSTHIFTMSFCNRSSKGQTEEHNGTKLQRNDDTHPTTGSHRERWSELLAKRPASKLGATAVMLLNTVVVKQMTNFGVKLNMHLLNRPYRDPPASETSRSWRLSAHHACVDVPRLVVKHQADGHQWDSSITYTSGHSFLHVNNNTTQHNATLQFKLRKLNVAHMNPFALRQDTRTSERIGVQRNLLLRPQSDSNHKIPTLSGAIMWEIWAMSSVGTSGSALDRISVLLEATQHCTETANSQLHHPRHPRALCFSGLPNPILLLLSVCSTNCKVTDSDWIPL